MTKRLLLSILVSTSGLLQAGTAVDRAGSEEWDRPSAAAAVRAVDVGAAAAEIGDISSLHDAGPTLNKLRKLQTRADWPLPAREAALYRFTRSLAGLPRDAVAGEVIRYLRNYRARTLVPHEDHAAALVPLFNIRGAAAGVENGWRRSEAAIEAGKLLAADPALLVAAYTDPAHQERRPGYLDALRYAEAGELSAVQALALERLREQPELTPLVAQTAVTTGDAQAMRGLLAAGRGPGIAASLQAFASGLQAAEIVSLLEFAVHDAPPANAALAMAAWWPRVAHEDAARDLLVGLLGHPALGAAAALTLARDADSATIRALQAAAGGDSVAAGRARLALDIDRRQLPGGPP